MKVLKNLTTIMLLTLLLVSCKKGKTTENPLLIGANTVILKSDGKESLFDVYIIFEDGSKVFALKFFGGDGSARTDVTEFTFKTNFN